VQKPFASTLLTHLSLSVNGEEKDFVSELSCEARAIEEIITPITGCPKHARSLEYGYTNPIKQLSYVLGEACYSTKQGRTLFVHTRLRAVKMEVQDLALKVRNKGYFHQEHPTKIYRNELMKALRREEHEDHLMQLLETKNVPKIGFKKFINEDLLTHKQYQPVTKLPWNYAILNDAEELENLEKLQEDISNLELKHVEVYAGSHGTLSLKNSEGVQVDISLKENKFPVPRYIWYVVRAETKATAFAVFNRASISEKERQKDSFCASKCEEITWLTTLLENKNYKKVESGYVLCCELNEFRRTVVEMPHLDVNDLLK
jgi:DNA/RNA non-specific endonuclease